MVLSRKEAREPKHSGTCKFLYSLFNGATPQFDLFLAFRTGLPLSTYFSAIKLRWMIDHHETVRQAHEEDDLLFGTVESWILYVGPACDLQNVSK